ncbi:gamma-glutamyltransferase [Kibdelosporangium persicum]|uniref:Glutathione hydrolase proenzyme n=1 Tax=Kibdelosporangium persicum TaxID=2698649 RepID=A0ABX2EZ39_9PSEU|nr:Gamma-glutamyltranspeptidase / glutathione hydrolase [Kibdelosporangium persicum]
MRRSAALVALLTATTVLVGGAEVGASPSRSKVPEATGYGGAVASIDADATAIGISVLRRGGNAVDAAVATAAALGVTDPFSNGIGGGGFFVFYEARTGKIHTIDGRETTPMAGSETMFQENGAPIPFAEGVTSGLSVGVPGTPRTWQRALQLWGRKSLKDVMKPAEQLARRGFVVDETFRNQITNNAARFSAFPSTRDLYLPGGQPPAVGTKFRNPDMANTYRELADTNLKSLYRGPIGKDIVKTVQQPPKDPASTLNVRPGKMTEADLARYDAPLRAPSKTTYRGLDIYSMAPPSSGGTTVGEALNILETKDVSKLSKVDYLHYFLESTRLAFADRNRWVGDPAFSDVPTNELLSQRFADSRACLINPNQALTSPVAPGDPRNPQPCATAGQGAPAEIGSQHTTHLTTADAWGNVVSYTLTIESEGGNGIVVPGRGFLLNNELTDFNFAPLVPGVPDPNLPAAGKRPRSSMAPTIVLRDGKPFLATGSPGGASIITTVTQVITGRVDRGMTLKNAIAEPRASQRNAALAQVEKEFLAQPEADPLMKRGQGFNVQAAAEIGAATGVERLPDGRWIAAAETVRRGGGSAAVVIPARW